MKNKQIIIVIVVLIIVGGLSFYAGTKVGGGNPNANKVGQFNAGGPNGMMRTNRGGAQAGSGFVNGEVLSKDATSVTVKLQNGGSKIIFLTAGTTVQKTVAGTIDDVVVGSQITANGQSNADGSINAISISQRPASVQGDTQGSSAQRNRTAN